MKRAGLTIAAVLLLISSAALAQNAITDWNEIGITAARASTAPGSATAGGTGIYMAYVHLAAYNAVNAIDRRFQPYKYSLPATPDASANAAAIEASYRTLVYLLPDQAAFLTTQYNSSLAAIPDGDAKTKGEMLGLASANALIALRTGDGRGASVPYTFPSVPTPGVWILTPGATAPQTPWVGQMRPFTFDDPARFLPDEPPPDLGSQTWADDYNQVKTLGALNSTVRTAWQTEVGRFWTDHATAQYGRMLRAIAGQRKLGLSDTARLFAMAYSASADGFIGCMNAKYHFSFWRPVTAIQNGDIDGNPDTVADPGWLGCLWLLRPTIRSIRPPTDASRAPWP
ncbi:MAG: vanadium-dependent haloperoxidase [Terriglobales bacterium]